MLPLVSDFEVRSKPVCEFSLASKLGCSSIMNHAHTTAANFNVYIDTVHMCAHGYKTYASGMTPLKHDWVTSFPLARNGLSGRCGPVRGGPVSRPTSEALGIPNSDLVTGDAGRIDPQKCHGLRPAI